MYWLVFFFFVTLHQWNKTTNQIFKIMKTIYYFSIAIFCLALILFAGAIAVQTDKEFFAMLVFVKLGAFLIGIISYSSKERAF